jgi:pimeloyl-ACP methyl ester carboxylesterase
MTSDTAPVSAFLEVGDTRIHYLDWRNDKPPVLIVHGNTHAGGVYSPLAERLAADFRVVAVDLRGHGLSSKSQDYAWPAMQGDVAALIDHLGLDDLLVVSHSRGGGVAMLATCARRDRVRGLVVFEPTVPPRLINPSTSEEDERAWAKARLARSEGRRSEFPSREAAYLHYQGRGAFKDWHDDWLRAFVEHCLVDNAAGGCELASPVEVESKLVLARIGMDPWSSLEPCEVPVLALFGEDGGRLGTSNDPVAAIRKLFPSTRVHVMEKTTHSAPMERPEVFESLVRAFARGEAAQRP